MTYIGRKEYFGGVLFDTKSHQYFSVDEKTWLYFENLYHNPTACLNDPAYESFIDFCKDRGFIDDTGL